MAPVSRLSVDLDLVFLPLGLSRDEALASISSELDGVRERAASIGLGVRAPRRLTGDDTQDLFATSVTARLLATSEIYAGKAVAALDRQHPRDLFDVWVRDQEGGYSSDDLDVFAVYLAGHNRPPHEVLAGRDKPVADLYASALMGMTSGPIPSVEQLDEVRRGLRRDVLQRMSPQAREFLSSFFSLAPAWHVLPFAGLEKLPALQWKLRNLEKFRSRRPEEFVRQNDELGALLASPAAD